METGARTDEGHEKFSFLSTAFECSTHLGYALVSAQGQILTWGENIARHSGIDSQKALGNDLAIAFGPSAGVTNAHLTALERARNGEVCEFRFERASFTGNPQIRDVALVALPQPIGEAAFVLTISDVTDTVIEFDRISQSERRFRTTFEQAAIGMALVSINGKWLCVNRAMCSIVGYPRLQLLSNNAPILTHPEDRDVEQIEQTRCLVGETNSYQIEKRYLHSDGYVVWVLKTVTLVRSERGEPSYFIAQVQDITARKNFVAALRDSEERFRLLSEHATDIIVRISPFGELEYVSPSVKRVLGFQPEDLVGHSTFDFIFEDDYNTVCDAHNKLMESLEPLTFAFRLHCADGSVVWCESQAMSIRDPQTSEVLNIIASMRDITQRKQLERKIDEQFMELNQQRTIVEAQKYELEQKQSELEIANQELERMANYDMLTAVENRRAFQQRIDREFTRPDQPLSLIILDVDHFKTFNDSFGHQAGDDVLRTVGKVLRQFTTDKEFPARYGGEEFVVLCPNCGLDQAAAIAERLRVAIENEKWDPRQVTASFGVATQSDSVDSPQKLIEAADTALYTSKKEGRNRVTVYDDLAAAA